MGRFEALNSKAERVSSLIRQTMKENGNIIIISHLDADGITAASILATAIYRHRGRFIVRIVGDMYPQLLPSLKDGEYDLHIFCDLGAGASGQLINLLGDAWIIVDHHQIPKEEMGLDQVFNAWQFNFDGSKEISAAGMAYLLALHINDANIDLSWLAVVGAIGDRQNQGDSRSLFGLNRRILEDAVRSQKVRATTDLIIYSRETKPIHVAIASTTMPFIPGLSGNEDASLAALASSNIPLKNNGKWRTITDLSEEEKRKVVEIIVPYLASGTSTNIEQLIGEVYTLVKEDEHSPLRDVSEFATLLNACGRMRKAGIGLSICLGDRDRAVKNAEEVLVEYRRILNEVVAKVMIDDKRVLRSKNWILIVGDDLVEEEMLGAISSILSSMSRFDGKVLAVKTTKNGEVRFSFRRTYGCDSRNLGSIVGEAASKCGGIGGGHDAAAGARIRSSQADDFLRYVDCGLE